MVGNAFHNSIEDGLLDIESRSSAATLAVIEEDRARGSRDGRVEVSVFENDVWRFAAKFQRHFFQIASRGMHDQLANFGGTGESYFVHVRMSGQSGACGLAVARNDVHDAFREPGF